MNYKRVKIFRFYFRIDNFLVLFFELDSQIYVIDEEHEEEIN